MIRTKILATVGPASRDIETLRRLIAAGCDAFRINFSHGSYDEHEQALAAIRQIERETGTPVAVVADLCGPKIRVGKIAGGKISLRPGGTIVVQRDPIDGTAERISTTLPELVDQAAVGEPLLLDDGKIRLEVMAVRNGELVCSIVVGGPLSSGKGINLPRTKLTLSALTDKDRADAAWIAAREFDYVALSFVREARDVVELRELLARHGSSAHIIAKIEKPAALDNIESIIDASDAIMVARGDLGVEMDLPAVPVAQKRLARLCQRACKPCIVATQMLESMIGSPTPTRAEVSDVANAVLDCADAVMLSGETAVGQFPVEAVAMMNRVVAAIESNGGTSAPGCDCGAAARFPLPSGGGSGRGEAPDEAADSVCRSVPSAIAAAIETMIGQLSVAAVAVFTISGATARLLSKRRLAVPILAMSPDIAAVRRMALYHGVAATRQTDPPEHTRDVLAIASRIAVEQGLAGEGDKIIVTSGRPIGQPGMTNNLAVQTIG